MLWSGPTDGVSDCTPYFDYAVNTIERGIVNTNHTGRTVNFPWGGMSGAVDRVLEFPGGMFCFHSPPRLLPQICIRGQGMLYTVFVKKFHAGAFFQSNGSKGNGIMIERLAAWNPIAYQPGYFIYFRGGAVYQPDAFILKDMWISSGDGGLWEHNIYLDGSLRTSPQGLRIGLVDNCHLFNGRLSAIYANNCVGLYVRGGGCYPGAGAVTGGKIIVTGGGAANLKSANCHFNQIILNTELNITNSTGCSFDGSIGSLATDGSTRWRIDAQCYGAVANNLVSSVVNLS